MTQMICPLSLIGNSSQTVANCQEFKCPLWTLHPDGNESCMMVQYLGFKTAYYSKKTMPFRFWRLNRNREIEGDKELNNLDLKEIK